MSHRFRKRIRLPDWDYSQHAIYMVTICVADRTYRLGEMTETCEVRLNNAGRMVEKEIMELAERFRQVEMDEFVVMPNHIHALIGIRRADFDPTLLELGSVVGALKSRTTNRYIRGVKMELLPPFDRHLWQRDYYETIMRDEKWVEARREYIVSNPANWHEDPDMHDGE